MSCHIWLGIFVVCHLSYLEIVDILFFCERLEPRSHFKSRLSLIVRVNVALNRTVVVDGDYLKVTILFIVRLQIIIILKCMYHVYVI